MKLSQLLVKYHNREREPRVVGRYFASDLADIIFKKLNPEDYFKPREIDEIGAKYISEGLAVEDFLTKIFKEMGINCEAQVKKEVQIDNGIILVAKCDFLFPNFVVELKRPKTLKTEIPLRWKFQCEAYYRIFQLPVKVWQWYYPCSILVRDYIPEKSRWELIKRKLREFHLKVAQASGLQKQIL